MSTTRGKTGGRKGSTVSGTTNEMIEVDGRDQQGKLYFDFDDSVDDVNVLPQFTHVVHLGLTY